MKNSSHSRHDEPHDESLGVPQDELGRVRDQLSARLRTRGVSVHGSDSADDLGTILEVVEQFENRVEAKGGDLMMDEAPRGKKSEPDNPAFVLPRRHAGESARSFIARVRATTSALYR